jgi:CO/xanthine dehydrogenase Mo-binding subunit
MDVPLSWVWVRQGDTDSTPFADIPPLETVLVPTSGGAGPYQAQALGEWANNATAAAIAHAVAAVGCLLFELPITAERVYAALHQVERPETA